MARFFCAAMALEAPLRKRAKAVPQSAFRRSACERWLFADDWATFAILGGREDECGTASISGSICLSFLLCRTENQGFLAATASAYPTGQLAAIAKPEFRCIRGRRRCS